MKQFILFFLLNGLCFISQSQTLFKHRWLLMSIDNLNTGIKKQIGDRLIADLIFDNDSTYHGEFCNKYVGKIKLNADLTCKMDFLEYGKRQCMGYSDVEAELYRLYPLVTKYILKNHLLYLFTSEQKRLVFKSE